MELRRAIKVSLKWLGVRDRRRIAALLQAYRGAVNFFIGLLWRDPRAGFDTATSKRLERTRLSARYRDQALKQAKEIVDSTRKSAQALGVVASRPQFRGMAILDAKFAQVLLGAGAGSGHDLVVRLSSLKRFKRLVLRSKRTSVLNRWLSRPGAELAAGCGLSDGELLTLWVKLPAPPKRRDGPLLGVDVGVTKLLATSEAEFFGRGFRRVRDKVRRRRPGSKGRRRARRERDHLVCAVVKKLPWERIRAIAFEDLARIKFGKRKGRGRSFRRALAAWRPPLVAQRLTCLAQEAGVYDVVVPSPWNSRTCPGCRHRARKNRQGEAFRCVQCGYAADADHVGALNAKRLGEELLGSRMEGWRKECLEQATARERRRAAAKRRGEAQAAKAKARRERAGGGALSTKT